LVFSRADAATAAGTFPVTLVVQGACSLQSAATLGFGSQTSISSNLDVSSAIGVVCTSATPYTIGLNAGAGSGATVASRLLTNGSATIPYAIYQDSGRTQVWGVTAGVDTQSGVGTGLVQSYTAYGRVAPVSNPTTGDYTDTVSVTVSY
jgi:spore coat protein U-like protein